MNKMHIRIAHFRERQCSHTGGGLSWGSAETPTEGKFWERRSCTRAGGAKLDPGLTGPQQARRSWLSTLLPCHFSTQAPSWASVLHTKTLPPSPDCSTKVKERICPLSTKVLGPLDRSAYWEIERPKATGTGSVVVLEPGELTVRVGARREGGDGF